MGWVYAVASGKGGVGKTTTVANLGAALAEAGHETVVVDADLGMGNLAGALGVDPEAGPTLHDVLAGRATVREALRDGPAGLSVLPGSSALDAFGDADPDNLGAALDELAVETVLIDTSAGLSHDSVEPLRVADEVLLVSTPERGAIADTAKTREMTARVGTPVAGVVVTRVTDDVDAATVGDRLDVPVRGTVPEDPSVSTAAEDGEPLVVAAPEAPATRAYRRLAVDFVGVEAVRPVEAVADEPTAGAGDDSESGDCGDADEPADGDDGDPDAPADEDDGDPDAPADGDDGDPDAPADEDDGDADEPADGDDGEAGASDADAPADGDDDGGDGRSGFLRWLLG